jgi:23S rRNA (pseudouridine1915-N3)-methyltransferase
LQAVKFVVVAVGHRMPAWVDAGFAEYSGRMPREARVELVALKPAPRGGATQRVLDTEGERILAAVPGGSYKVVLDERGTLVRTTELARRMARWRENGRDIALIVGGADGLPADATPRAGAGAGGGAALSRAHDIAQSSLSQGVMGNA